jgi:hypothetical protein
MQTNRWHDNTNFGDAPSPSADHKCVLLAHASIFYNCQAKKWDNPSPLDE